MEGVGASAINTSYVEAAVEAAVVAVSASHDSVVLATVLDREGMFSMSTLFLALKRLKLHLGASSHEG